LSILPSESSASKLSTATTPLLLEVGVLGATCPKVGECLLQISQSLLQWHRTDFIEELQVFLLFPVRQHSGCLLVVNPLPMSVPTFSASMQSQVVDQPHATQRAAQEFFLFQRWVKAVSVGFFCHALHFTTLCVKPS
jgi:hypothetical protein